MVGADVNARHLPGRESPPDPRPVGTRPPAIAHRGEVPPVRRKTTLRLPPGRPFRTSTMLSRSVQEAEDGTQELQHRVMSDTGLAPGVVMRGNTVPMLSPTDMTLIRGNGESTAPILFVEIGAELFPRQRTRANEQTAQQQAGARPRAIGNRAITSAATYRPSSLQSGYIAHQISSNPPLLEADVLIATYRLQPQLTPKGK